MKRKRAPRTPPIDKNNVGDFCKRLKPIWDAEYERLTGQPVTPLTPEETQALIDKWKALLPRLRKTQR